MLTPRSAASATIAAVSAAAIPRLRATGNVATPQLHFELRKGSTPVDPTQYLAGL